MPENNHDWWDEPTRPISLEELQEIEHFKQQQSREEVQGLYRRLLEEATPETRAILEMVHAPMFAFNKMAHIYFGHVVSCPLSTEDIIGGLVSLLLWHGWLQENPDRLQAMYEFITIVQPPKDIQEKPLPQSYEDYALYFAREAQRDVDATQAQLDELMAE